MKILRHSQSVLLLQQTSSIEFPGLRPVFIYSKNLENGPKDDLIENVRVRESVNWAETDFLNQKNVKLIEAAIDHKSESSINVYNPKDVNAETELIRKFDMVNSYAVARLVLTMFQRSFKTNDSLLQGYNFNLIEAWGGKLRIDAYAFDQNMPIAQYSFNFDTNINCIDLGRYQIDGKYHYSCRNFDAIAHETGHAVFTALRRKHWNKEKDRETYALEEAFCDLTCLLSLLHQLDVCQALIAVTKGDLSSKNFLSQIGEGLCHLQHALKGLRDLNPDVALRYEDLVNRKDLTAYQFGALFSTAFYEFLNQLYQSYSHPDSYSQAETIHIIGRYLTDLILISLFRTQEEEVLSFRRMASVMYDTIDDLEFVLPGCGKVPSDDIKQQLYDSFEQRGIYLL